MPVKETFIYQLDLPDPSPILLGALREALGGVELEISTAEWAEEFTGKSPAAKSRFFRCSQVDQMVRDQYEEYFPGKTIRVILGVLEPNVGTPAFHLPHTDRGRAMAVNYYIDLGGDDVKTCFYDKVEQTNSQSAKNFRYSEVSEIGRYVFQKNKWYAFDVNRAHSIENIYSRRNILVLSLNDSGNSPDQDTYTLENFRVDYPKVIAQIIKI